jgi:uncharacterized protein YbjT (DUF2867 family)
VRALVRDPQGVPRELERDTEVVAANPVDAESLRAAMSDVDMVVHCAALTTNDAPLVAPRGDQRRGHARRVRAGARGRGRRMVHVSSVIVYEGRCLLERRLRGQISTGTQGSVFNRP